MTTFFTYLFYPLCPLWNINNTSLHPFSPILHSMLYFIQCVFYLTEFGHVSSMTGGFCPTSSLLPGSILCKAVLGIRVISKDLFSNWLSDFFFNVYSGRTSMKVSHVNSLQHGRKQMILNFKQLVWQPTWGWMELVEYFSSCIFNSCSILIWNV